jgi:hypothetical protein
MTPSQRRFFTLLIGLLAVVAVPAVFQWEATERVAIYNVKGELVAVLAEGNLGAGEHIFTWHAAERPSGIYFYRLELPGHSETRKMIMLK